MFKKSTILVLVLVVLLIIFRAFIVDSCSSKDAEYTEIRPNNVAYVGDQSCKKCHNTEFHEWEQSHHYMSMLPPNDSTVKGDFNNVTFTAPRQKAWILFYAVHQFKHLTCCICD